MISTEKKSAERTHKLKLKSKQREGNTRTQEKKITRSFLIQAITLPKMRGLNSIFFIKFVSLVKTNDSNCVAAGRMPEVENV